MNLDIYKVHYNSIWILLLVVWLMEDKSLKTIENRVREVAEV